MKLKDLKPENIVFDNPPNKKKKKHGYKYGKSKNTGHRARIKTKLKTLEIGIIMKNNTDSKNNHSDKLKHKQQ